MSLVLRRKLLHNHTPVKKKKPFVCNSSVSGEYPAKAGEGKREEKNNAKAQSRREEDEKDTPPWRGCPGMVILPMIPTGPPPEAGDATSETPVLFALKSTGRPGVPTDVNAFAPLLQPSLPVPPVTDAIRLSCGCILPRACPASASPTFLIVGIINSAAISCPSDVSSRLRLFLSDFPSP